MRTHLNSGHDIEAASQIMTAIESSGGISGVRVTVSGPQPAAKSTPVKWEGVSFINNIAYTQEGLHVWRASMSVEDGGSVVPMGWALKSAGVQRKNLTVAQKNYLTEAFQVGERTGQKADPTSVSKAMRRVKHSDGSNIFDKRYYLTPLQIAGFFSRLSAKKTYSVEQSSEEEEPEKNELITEKAIEEMFNEVTKALALQHSIIYETYNICEIVGQSRLAKVSIPTLQNICAALELDVASMTGQRKQQYMEIIEGVVARCGCKTSKADQNM